MRPTLLALILGLAAPAGAQAWTQQSPATQPPSTVADTVYFNTSAGKVSALANASNRYQQLWSWNGSDWSDDGPTMGLGPSIRSGLSVGYDTDANKLYLSGGINTFGLVSDLYFLDMNALLWINAGAGPSGRLRSAMAYDAARMQMVLFGGWTMTGELDDTMTSAGPGFSARTVMNKPEARGGHAMAYDADRQRVVLYGGSTNSTQSLPGYTDTWEWDGTDWARMTTTHSPQPRVLASMAYDSMRKVVVLYGGQTENFSMRLTDTWEYDGIDWTEVATSGPDQSGGRIVYDATAGELVYVGGSPLETWTFGAPPMASVEQFGDGCAGSAGVPVLDAAPGSLPKINGTFTLQLSGLPAGNLGAYLVIGFSNTDWAGIPLPGDLTLFGIWGCTVYVSVDAAIPVMTSGGAGQYGLAIPNDPALVGLHFFNQGLVTDPGINPFGAVVTNALEGIIGPL